MKNIFSKKVGQMANKEEMVIYKDRSTLITAIICYGQIVFMTYNKKGLLLFSEVYSDDDYDDDLGNFGNYAKPEKKFSETMVLKIRDEFQLMVHNLGLVECDELLCFNCGRVNDCFVSHCDVCDSEL